MNLSDSLKKGNGTTDEQIENLYVAYNMSSIVLSLASGFLLRKYGPMIGYIFLLATFLGQVAFCCGVWFNLYWLMYAGRIVYGGGACTSGVATFYLIKLYVPEAYAVITLSMIILVCRINSMLSTIANAFLYDLSGGFTVPLILTIVTCFLPVVIYIWYFETQRKKDESKLEDISEITFNCKD